MKNSAYLVLSQPSWWALELSETRVLGSARCLIKKKKLIVSDR